MMQLMKKLFVLVTILMMLGISTKAADYSPQQEEVDEAYHVLAKMLQNPDYHEMQELLPRAKGILIVPSFWRAGFIFGGEYGTGVLLVRGGNNTWSYPVFYNLITGNVGLQAGFQNSEEVLLIMRDEAIEYFVDGKKFKLGGNVAVSVGPVGAGLKAATTGEFNSAIISFSRGWGLFGGGAIDGSWIVSDDDWNQAYYGQGANANTIVYEGNLSNPGADRLRELLEKN